MDGFRNEKRVVILGRTFKQLFNSRFYRKQKRIDHFINFLKIFISFNASKVEAQFTYNDHQKQVLTSNRHGLILTDLAISPEIQEAHLSLKKSKNTPSKETSLSIYGPTDKTQRIIISDIDDTIIKSRATSLIRLFATSLFNPIGKRKVFPITASFYSKLAQGKDNNEENLFFYVSSSHWALYPFLKALISSESFPKAPILLKNINLSESDQKSKGHQHKYAKISYLLSFYPHLDFILIGDEAQDDFRIYTQLAKDYKDRVSHIYIRRKWWKKYSPNDEVIKSQIGKTQVQFFDEVSELS